MGTSFGDANQESFHDVIQNEEFKVKTSINKDQIAICQDCEFRYICTDCRAYLLDQDNPLSKPLKCAYDPYTGVWKE